MQRFAPGRALQLATAWRLHPDPERPARAANKIEESPASPGPDAAVVSW
jgi:hypothetical protein